MTANPEQAVIDAIDELVDDQLAGYKDRSGYDHNINQVRCSLCHRAWHGLREGYCPGAFATGPQRIRFRRLRELMQGELDPGFAATGRLSPGYTIGRLWSIPDDDNPIRQACRAMQSLSAAFATLVAIPVLRLPVFEQPAEPSEVQPPDPAAPWFVEFRAYIPEHPNATVTFTPLRSHDCAVVPVWDGPIANA